MITWLVMISQVLGSSKVQEAVSGRKKEEVRVMIDTQDLNSGPEELSCLNAEKQ